MIDRLISALMALSLAFLVWLYARGRDQESLDNVPIPVQLSLAPGQADHYDLEVTGPSQVLVSFTGPPSCMRELRGQLQRGEVRVEITVAVPDDSQTEGRFLDTVRVEPADLHVPPGVTPAVLEGRNRIPVTLHRLVERRLPVHFDHTPEERIAQIVVEPGTVLVRGPQDILDRESTVPTLPCTLPQDLGEDSAHETVCVRKVPLVGQLDGRPVRASPAAVVVRLTLRPRHQLYELTDVPVQFLCPPNFSLRPRFGDERAGRITLRVVGPAAATPPAVTAFIDLAAGKFEPGLYADEPIRLQLPRDFQLAQDPPRSAAFQLTPVGAAGDGQHLAQDS